MPTHARREAARAFRSARGVAIPVALAWVGGLGLGGAVLVSAMPVGSGSVPYRDPLMRGGELLPDWHPA